MELNWEVGMRDGVIVKVGADVGLVDGATQV